ncbi:hypothetical protein [Nocardiopsis synnemataformans]|uniref:hypothetical protein n=1 Tax=Nocardiopsis synnemataformans TaxID=61305 RepID=UPI003EBB2606
MKALSGLTNLISTTLLGMLTAANVVQGHLLLAVLTGVAAVCTAIASVRWYRRAYREQVVRNNEGTDHSATPSPE